MTFKSLLLLEDDLRLREALSDDFKDRGYEVSAFESMQSLQSSSDSEKKFDYAILDLRLVNETGLSALTKIREKSPECRVVILTGYGSVATAVEAMKLGAVNYLNKPASADVIESALKDELKNSEDKIKSAEKILSLNQHEHEYIQFVLTQNDGNISKTAKQLGLHRQSLQRKLKKYPT